MGIKENLGCALQLPHTHPFTPSNGCLGAWEAVTHYYPPEFFLKKKRNWNNSKDITYIWYRRPPFLDPNSNINLKYYFLRKFNQIYLTYAPFSTSEFDFKIFKLRVFTIRSTRFDPIQYRLCQKRKQILKNKNTKSILAYKSCIYVIFNQKSKGVCVVWKLASYSIKSIRFMDQDAHDYIIRRT